MESSLNLTQKIVEIDGAYLENTLDDRIIIVSRYDDSDKWAGFICKQVKGTMLCGGYIELDQPIAALLKWMDEMRTRGIQVIVNEEWFSTNSFSVGF